MKQKLLTPLPVAVRTTDLSAAPNRSAAMRLMGVDRLRIGLTALVIDHHAARQQPRRI